MAILANGIQFSSVKYLMQGQGQRNPASGLNV